MKKILFIVLSLFVSFCYAFGRDEMLPPIQSNMDARNLHQSQTGNYSVQTTDTKEVNGSTENSSTITNNQTGKSYTEQGNYDATNNNGDINRNYSGTLTNNQTGASDNITANSSHVINNGYAVNSASAQVTNNQTGATKTTSATQVVPNGGSAVVVYPEPAPFYYGAGATVVVGGTSAAVINHNESTPSTQVESGHLVLTQ